MASSKKASAQKKGQVSKRTPPATPRNKEQVKRRSASPSNQRTPLAVRDEPPARSTRSRVKAPMFSEIPTPTAAQRKAIDCPFVCCRALTEHQHLPQMQYYKPHPDRAVRSHSSGNSIGDTPSEPSDLPASRQHHGGSPVDAGHDEVAEKEQETEDQVIVAVDDETATQEQLEPGFAQRAAESVPSLEEVDEVEEPTDTWDKLAFDETVQDEGTSGLPQAPMTPPPSSPMAAEESPSVQPSDTSSEQHDVAQQPATPPAPQVRFGNWLPGQSPDDNTSNASAQHTHTYEELIRPLVDPTLPPAPGMEEVTRILQDYRSPWDRSYRPGMLEEDPDLPSLIMRPPVTEYMRQFEAEAETEEYDYEMDVWQ